MTSDVSSLGEASGGSVSEQQALARGTTINIVSAGFSTVANFALIWLVTRGFDQVDAGVLFAATSVFLVALRLSQLGTDTGLIYFMSRQRAQGRLAQHPALLRMAATPALLAALAIGAGLALVGLAFPELFVKGDPGALPTYLVILGVVLPIAVLSQQWLAATRGFGRMRPTSVLERTLRPGLQVLLVFGAVTLSSTLALGVAWALPYVPTALLAWWWVRRHGAKYGTAPLETSRSEFWRFTGPRGAQSIIQLTIQRLDIVLVSAMLGPAEAAVYTVATRFLVVGKSLGWAMTQAVEPRLGRRISDGDVEGTRSLYQTATSWLVLVNWPVYLVLALLAAPVLSLFGADYVEGQAVVVILCLTMLLSSGCGGVGALLNMGGKTSWTLADAAVALVANISLNLLLIPRFGLIGAAVAWTVSIATVNLVPLVQLGMYLRMHPFGRATRLAMAMSLACFAPPLLLRAVMGPLPLLLAIGLLTIGTVAFLAAAWHWRSSLELDEFLAALPLPIGNRSHA